MIKISQEMYDFCKNAYEKTCRKLFDDAVDFSDGEKIQVVFENLRKLGDELNIKIESLAIEDDLERLKQDIEYDNEVFEEGISDSISEETLTNSYLINNEVAVARENFWSERYAPSRTDIETYNKIMDTSDEIQDKLKQLSINRFISDKEMIGSWTTYEIEDDQNTQEV